MKNIAITENHLYLKAYKKGIRAVSPSVAVYVLRDYKAEKLKRANPQKVAINRVGIAVTKKLGGAVERNRAKRVARAAMQAMQTHAGQEGVKLKTGNLIVLSLRPAILSKKSNEVETELRTSFGKLEMLRRATPVAPKVKVPEPEPASETDTKV